MSRWKKLTYCPEPIIMVYFFGVLFNGPVVEQFVYGFYSNEFGYNYSYSGSSANCPTDQPRNSTERVLLKKVQDKVASFMVGQSFCQVLPSVVLCLFIGPLSDHIGRKPIIVTNLLGSLASSILNVLIAFYKLNIKYVYLSSFFNGITGSYISVIMAVSAYLCDIVEGRNRALRLAVIELLVFLSLTLSSYAGGIYLTKFGFLNAFCMVLACSGTSLIGAIFILSESLPKEKRVGGTSHCIALPGRVYRVLRKPRPGRWKIGILSAAVSLLVLTSPSAVMPVMLLYFLNLPFCWSAEDIGYFRGTYFAIQGIGSVIGVKLLPKLISDGFTMILSCLSGSGLLIVVALAKTTAQSYTGLAVGFFGSVTAALLSGILSQTVDETEQGALFAFLGSIRALFIFIGNFMYQSIYKLANKHDKPGTTFILASFMMVSTIIFLIIFVVKDHKSMLQHPTDENANVPYKELSDTPPDDVLTPDTDENHALLS